MFDAVVERTYDEDVVSPKTTFVIRPLKLGDVLAAEGSLRPEVDRPGDRLLAVLRRGILAWSNLFCVRRNQDGTVERKEVVFNERAISCLPYGVRRWLAHEIQVISTLPEERREHLRAAVRAAHLRATAKSDKTWDCASCETIPRLQQARKCPLVDKKGRPKQDAVIDPRDEKYLMPWDRENLKKGKLSRWLTYGGHQYKECPIGVADSVSYRLLKIVIECESKHCLPCEPPVLMAQPNVYIEAQSVVDSERNAIDKLKKDKQTVKPTDYTDKRRQAKNEATVRGLGKRPEDADRAPAPRRVPLGRRGEE